jgi:predicted metal-dependent peptidase
MGEADAETVEEWKQHIANAAKVAKMKGNCPAIGQDFLAALERPSRDWRDIVRSQASEIYRNRYTQKRTARRSHAIGVKLPGRQPKPKPAVVAMDCSGSISAMAGRFASEIVGILSASGAPEVIVMFHDVAVYHVDAYSKDDLRQLKVSHGGTSHRDVFEKLKEIEPLPGMLVCFTDLYSDQMEISDPGIPVIWAHPEGIGEEMEIPFGKKVVVTNDGGE